MKPFGYRSVASRARRSSAVISPLPGHVRQLPFDTIASSVYATLQASYVDELGDVGLSGRSFGNDRPSQAAMTMNEPTRPKRSATRNKTQLCGF